MVYLAIGKGSGKYTAWSGLCRLPWLKTLLESENSGINWGGGYFSDRNVLITNGWTEVTHPTGFPFKLASEPLTYFAAENRGMLYEKFARDGFRSIGDDCWSKRPSQRHPELKVSYLGYDHSDLFAFTLDEPPELLDGANWAIWDCVNNLWVARLGIVEQYTLDDMRNGKLSYTLDVDQFEPPAKRDRSFEQKS